MSLKTIGGIFILLVSLASLVFDFIPYVWIGGFIWAVYLFYTEYQRSVMDNAFLSVASYKVKASDETELNSRVQEISNKYGVGYVVDYLTQVEKLPQDEVSMVIFNNLVGSSFSSPARKILDNPCSDCDGFGFTKKKHTNIFGTVNKNIQCDKCKGSGAKSER